MAVRTLLNCERCSTSGWSTFKPNARLSGSSALRPPRSAMRVQVLDALGAALTPLADFAKRDDSIAWRDRAGLGRGLGSLGARLRWRAGCALCRRRRRKARRFLRGLVAAEAGFSFEAREWPDVFDALIAPEVVKPAQGSDARVSIWGALEARLAVARHAGGRRPERGRVAAQGSLRPLHVAHHEGGHRPGAAGAAHRPVGA